MHQERISTGREAKELPTWTGGATCWMMHGDNTYESLCHSLLTNQCSWPSLGGCKAHIFSCLRPEFSFGAFLLPLLIIIFPPRSFNMLVVVTTLHHWRTYSFSAPTYGWVLMTANDLFFIFPHASRGVPPKGKLFLREKMKSLHKQLISQSSGHFTDRQTCSSNAEKVSDVFWRLLCRCVKSDRFEAFAPHTGCHGWALYKPWGTAISNSTGVWEVASIACSSRFRMWRLKCSLFVTYVVC